MTIRVKSVLVGSLFALASFFISRNKNHNKIIKKYDIDYIIKAEPDTTTQTAFSLSKIIMVLENRFKNAGYEYKIIKNGGNKIHVSIFQATDTLYTNSIITYNQRVQFRELYNVAELSEMIKTTLAIIEKIDTLNKKAETPTKRDSMAKKVNDLLDNMEMRATNNIAEDRLIVFSQPFTDQNSVTVHPAEIGRIRIADTSIVRQLFENPEIKIKSPQDMSLCFGKIEEPRSQKKEIETIPFYFTRGDLNEKALLENEDVENAFYSFSNDGHPEVVIEFDRFGAQKWSYLTKENVGNHIAIIVGNSVISAPKVLSSIENGRASISGGYTTEECKLLSMALKSNRLPAKLTIESATIKEQSQNPLDRIQLLTICLIFIAFSLISFFVFKALKVD